MKQLATILLAFVLLSCSYIGASSISGEKKVRSYASTAVRLSDISMKIISYYESRNLSVPKNFDTQQFFGLLQKIYPDQAEIKPIKNDYRVSVRNVDGGYSVMLCDPKTNQKVMEDLSCHIDHVEIRSWENPATTPCVFEKNWKPYCQ